jgi:hypothetical protein
MSMFIVLSRLAVAVLVLLLQGQWRFLPSQTLVVKDS